MSIKSNLYAESVFAEHPTSLWTLDSQCDYISLIPDSSRNIGAWTVTSGSRTVVSRSYDFLPIQDSPAYSISFASDTVLTSPQILASSLSDIGTLAISMHVFLESSINSITVGISSSSGNQTHQFTNIQTGKWVFLSKIFNTPSANFNITVSADVSATTVVSFNGISIGHLSENFAFYSLGIVPELITDSISLDNLSGCRAESYGVLSNDGYFLVESNKLLARQSGVPLTFGTQSSVVIIPSSNEIPSLIIPGLGMMNESDKSSTYTLEFWTRIFSTSSSRRRIVGPISSSDGIYVEGPFIGINIGGKEKNHYVGEWYRPMLIQLVTTESSATLIINGESVVSIELSGISYAEQYDSFGRSNDWIGFYAYEDVPNIEIECVAIYPYSVSPVIAKRRFVYGQAVDNLNVIDSKYNGTSVVTDARLARHSNVYSYPDMGRWNQGVSENMSLDGETLSSQTYSQPSIAFNNATVSEWQKDILALSDYIGNVLSLRPNDSWSETEGYIVFERFSLSGQRTRAIYGSFEADQNYSGYSTLIRLVDEETSNYLSIDLDEDEIVYKFFYSGQEVEELLRIKAEDGISDAKIGLGEIFSVGIDIKTFSDVFGGNVDLFLNSRGRLSVYVGGTREFENTFGGFIHRVGFSTERNFLKISQFFDDNGVIPITEAIYDGGIQGSEIVNLATNPSFETVTSGTTVVRTNLVTNPSVESNTTSWAIVSGNGGRVTTESYIGNASFQHISTGSPEAVEISVSTPFTPSLTYTASVWVKGEVGKSVRIDLREQDAAGATIGTTFGTAVVMTGNWQRLSIAREFGATGVRAKIIVRNQTTGAHTYYIDAALLEASTTLMDYFDGSTTAGGDFTYAWTGTANASASVQNAVGVASIIGGAGRVVYQSQEWAKSGARSVRVSPTSTSSGSASFGVGVARNSAGAMALLVANTTYTAIATFRQSSPQTSPVNNRARRIYLSNIGAGTILASSPQAPNVAGETTLVLTFTVPSGVPTGNLILYLGGGTTAGNGDVWWDDFMLIEGTYTGDYFDGDTQDIVDQKNYYWTGTPHASTSTFDDDSFTELLDGGFAATVFANSVFENVATYTLFPNGRSSIFNIATDSYWEDYVPLSRLSKSVSSQTGGRQNTLDFIQFNIDYPRPIKVSGSSLESGSEVVRSYISFQYIKNGANKRFQDLPNYVAAPKSGLVVPDANWQTTKYEVYDGVIIVPPSGVNKNDLAIVIHIDAKTPGVLTKNIGVRFISLSSRSLERAKPNEIGTRFSGPIIPYKKYGIYSDYSALVPFSIHKESSPYLYLTSDYGIRLIGEQDSSGLSIPVNTSADQDFNVSFVSFMMNEIFESFTEELTIMEIDSKTEKIKICLVPDQTDSSRASIIARDYDTGQKVLGVIFFINGTPSPTPTVSKNSWNHISVLFEKNIDFSQTTGSINIVGRQAIGSVSIYRQSAFDAKREESVTNPTLISVGADTLVPQFSWGTNKGAFGQSYFGADPIEVYASLTGTDRLVIGDDIPATFDNYQYSVIKDITFKSITVSPV